jgi:GxxExxY protein
MKTSHVEPGDLLSGEVIAAAIEVHRQLGPGLLESAYQQCLAAEFHHRGLAFCREVPLPVRYRDQVIDCAYRLDFVVEETLILEVKAVAKMEPVFEAQLLTYLRLAGIPLGLLINFHVPVLKAGIVRRVLSLPPAISAPPR